MTDAGDNALLDGLIAKVTANVKARTLDFLTEAILVDSLLPESDASDIEKGWVLLSGYIYGVAAAFGSILGRVEYTILRTGEGPATDNDRGKSLITVLVKCAMLVDENKKAEFAAMEKDPP